MHYHCCVEVNIHFFITGDSLRHKAIDNALVKMLVLDMQPANIVHDKGFQEFLN